MPTPLRKRRGKAASLTVPKRVPAPSSCCSHERTKAWARDLAGPLTLALLPHQAEGLVVDQEPTLLSWPSRRWEGGKPPVARCPEQPGWAGLAEDGMGPQPGPSASEEPACWDLSLCSWGVQFGPVEAVLMNCVQCSRKWPTRRLAGSTHC